MYNYGKHVFSLQWNPAADHHDYQIEISRSRQWKALELKTTIGMFFNETFTGMTIKDWGSEDFETPWRYVFHGKEVTASTLVRKLNEWLGDTDSKNFINDLNRTRRETLDSTMKWWQRDNNMFDK